MVADFKIEKDVPLPGKAGGRKKYPLSLMEVGDSFVVAESEGNRVASAASGWGKVHGWTFTIRFIDGAYRCWRIA
ncbi:MAG: hypothetical protein H0T60_10340 [Acidobacteria bacterium]|nr:hypothetical protein [Acidobacteriota bacterium]